MPTRFVPTGKPRAASISIGAPAKTAYSLAGGETLDSLRQEAEEGDSRAQFLLSGRYRGGIGTERDMKEGVYWLRKAAESGHAEAQRIYAAGLYFGEGCPMNEPESLYWFCLAAEGGDPEAPLILARIYKEG